jgi:Trk K+ transport system NAD-binding subunit
MRLKVQASFYIDNELLNISEMLIEPGSPVEGWSIQRLERELELTVVSYTEGKTTHLHPGSDLSLNAGGKISALASIETLNRLAGMARQKPAKK